VSLWKAASYAISTRLSFLTIRAHVGHDAKALQALSPHVVDPWKKRGLRSLAEAAKEAKTAPILLDVRYAGKTLAESLWPPQEGCGTITLPYNGGQLNAAEFTVVSYLSASAPDSEPAVLIVVAPPVLSDLEQRALEAVPAQYLEMMVGGSPVACTALATVVVFVAAVTVVTTCCQPFHDKLAEVELTAQSLKELGAMPSLAQLLAVRAQIFEEFNVR
jgi:hypothetical protein